MQRLVLVLIYLVVPVAALEMSRLPPDAPVAPAGWEMAHTLHGSVERIPPMTN